jgi:2-haloacid dehalogenase
VLEDVAGTGLTCLALSNMEADTFVVRRDRFPFFRFFDGCVISGVEGVAKPDRKIFEILLSRYDLDPAATVFTDDNPANVTAAREVGLDAIPYTTAAGLRGALRARGIPIEP